VISFVYLGVGRFRDIPVFKIGKALHPKRRTTKLRIKLVGYIVCADESEAFALEHIIRQRIRGLNARNVGKTSDWFYYNAAAFREVRSWFSLETADVIEIVTYINQHVDPFALFEEEVQLLREIISLKDQMIDKLNQQIKILSNTVDMSSEAIRQSIRVLDRLDPKYRSSEKNSAGD